jgi:hypothetical protein
LFFSLDFQNLIPVNTVGVSDWSETVLNDSSLTFSISLLAFSSENNNISNHDIFHLPSIVLSCIPLTCY